MLSVDDVDIMLMMLISLLILVMSLILLMILIYLLMILIYLMMIFDAFVIFIVDDMISLLMLISILDVITAVTMKKSTILKSVAVVVDSVSLFVEEQNTALHFVFYALLMEGQLRRMED